jgi:hypothetical protein
VLLVIGLNLRKLVIVLRNFSVGTDINSMGIITHTRSKKYTGNLIGEIKEKHQL